jgi:hypothetical protein
MTRRSVTNPMRTCADCDFWVQHSKSDATGDCRESPPRIIDAIVDHELQDDPTRVISDAIMEATRWPTTVEHYSCAKWARIGGDLPL